MLAISSDVCRTQTICPPGKCSGRTEHSVPRNKMLPTKQLSTRTRRPLPTSTHSDASFSPSRTTNSSAATLLQQIRLPRSFYPTRTVFDIEGNQREVIDAKDRVVMRYDYDMLSNRIRQASMEAGERWMSTMWQANPSMPGIAGIINSA